MTGYLKITKAAIITFFIALLLAFLTSTIYAQESPEELVAKYDIAFPITELGNCGSYADCRTFCEDPLNSTSCIDYAKGKGFYQDDPVIADKDRILTQAKSVLGCDSFEACQNYCEVPANFDRCASFASSQGIVGGHIDDPSSRVIISRAAEVLGCTSVNACEAFCSEEANAQRCSDFAGQVGLRGGERPVGPGGCTSESTCKSFCSDPNNFQICKGFHDVAGAQFIGPGGCNSEESCRTYCQQNEAECRASFGGPGIGDSGSLRPGYNPAEMCNRTPNCAWTNNGCQCGFYGETRETAQKAGEYAAYCQANPDKCKVGQPGAFDTSQRRQEFESYCSQNPDRCRPPTTVGTSGDVFDPATQCARYGCNWTNNTCQCTSENIPTYDPARECSRIPRCSWTGSTCNCTYIPPAGPEGCPDGQYIGPGGYCISGSTPPPSGGCPQGQYIGPGGYCISGSGTTSTPPPGTGTSCPQGQYIGPGGYCIPSGGTYSPPPYSPAPTSTYYPQATYYPSPTYQPSSDPASACSSQSGCSWTGSSCQCSSSGGTSGTTSTPQPTSTQSTPQPAPIESTPPPAESSGGSSGSCPQGSYMQDGACVQGVYGVSTQRSLLDTILDWMGL